MPICWCTRGAAAFVVRVARDNSAVRECFEGQLARWRKNEMLIVTSRARARVNLRGAMSRYGLVAALLVAGLWPCTVRAEGVLPRPVECPKCWHPDLKTSWDWYLDKVLVPPYRDVDMYDVDYEYTSADTVGDLKRRPGRKVVCYISAGTWEAKRPDAKFYPERVLGTTNEDWPDELERWVDVADVQKPDSALAGILRARLDTCAQKGFDGVEFDNVDVYQKNAKGEPRAGTFKDGDGRERALTAWDQLYFNIWLANEAHTRGLSAGLKNDGAQIPQLVDYFDWALNEGCYEEPERHSRRHHCLTKDNVKLEEGKYGYDMFTKRGKAVFGVTYPENSPDKGMNAEAFAEWAKKEKLRVCPLANAANFNWILKTKDLRGDWAACR